MANMIEAGGAFIRLSVNDKELSAGLAQVQSNLQLFSQNLKNLSELETGFKAGAKGAGVFNAALSFIAANPVTVAIMALVGAFKLVSYWQEQSAASMAQYTAKCKEEAEAAAKVSKATSDRIDKEQAQMQRLDELSNRQNLLSYEQNEAADIISELTARYGDLGIQIDKTTGKIVGLSDAQARLSKQQREEMRQAKIEESAKYAIAEDALRFQTIRRFTGNWETDSNKELKKLMYAGDYWGALNYARNDNYDESTINNIKELITLQEQSNAALKEADRLSKVSTRGTPITQTGQAAQRKAADTAYKALLDANKAVTASIQAGMSDTDRSIQGEIDKIAELQKKEADFRAALKAYQRKLSASEIKARDEELSKAIAVHKAKIEQIKEEAEAKKKAELTAQQAELTAEEERQRQYREFIGQLDTKNAEIAAEKNATPAEKQAILEDTAKLLSQQRTRYAALLEGGVTSDEKAEADALMQSIPALTEKAQRIAEGLSMASDTTKVSGSYRLGDLMQMNSPEAQTAENTKNLLTEVKGIKSNMTTTYGA